jgi:outer membrane protein
MHSIHPGKNAPATSTSGSHPAANAKSGAKASPGARQGLPEHRAFTNVVDMSRAGDLDGSKVRAAMARTVVIACLASVSACADVPWRAERAAPPSAAQAFVDDSPGVSTPAPPAVFDRAHEYALVELIDLAQRSNPETREAWHRARAEAARLGGAEAVYLPSLTLVTAGGMQSVTYPGPNGAFSATGPYLEPELQLAWTLLDLSRFARVSEVRARVTEANFVFSRKHQEVLFAVARAYYALDANRAELEAARATLETARVVEQEAEARLLLGLATQPEVLLAREARTRAQFDVEAADGAVRTAEGALAESVGVAPDPPLKVAFADRPEPAHLASSVEEVMRLTLARRPDLRAQRAEVAARQADERAARGRFAPRHSLDTAGGYEWWAFQASPGGGHTLSAATFDAHLTFALGLFQGFEDVEAVHEAQSERAASEAALAAGTLRALRETWTAYFDVKTAERKVEFADALLASSNESYSASLETYHHGLGSLIDLLTAERDLAAARSIAIASHAELLIAAAALTYAIGAMPPGAR